MEIIGWIREGDRAACNGVVLEGDQFCKSHGRAYAFEGAKLACQKKCSIVEGFTRRTLTNGLKAVIHGMKTSGGCPLLSTLNDQDGVGNETGTVEICVLVLRHRRRLLRMAPILYLDYNGVLHTADVRIAKFEPLRPRIYQKGQ